MMFYPFWAHYLSVGGTLGMLRGTYPNLNNPGRKNYLREGRERRRWKLQMKQGMHRLWITMEPKNHEGKGSHGELRCPIHQSAITSLGQ